MKLKNIFVFFAFALLGCASANNAETNPAYVSPARYQKYNCNQLHAEMKRVSARLDQENKSQATNQVLDAAVTVFAISRGYGVGTQEESVEVKRMRNQYDLLEQGLIEKECN